MFNANAATNGGGDTGSVLISPYIKPRTVSKRFYNHYSWLRTMEDLFDVSRASGGLDRHGHIGYAAQRGLAPFGSDVFNNARGKPIRPRISFATDRVAQASSAQPRLAVQGDTVSVAVGHSWALATTVGLTVPAPDPAAGPTSTQCTFKVTLVARSGSVPVSPAAFTILDGRAAYIVRPCPSLEAVHRRPRSFPAVR